MLKVERSVLKWRSHFVCGGWGTFRFLPSSRFFENNQTTVERFSIEGSKTKTKAIITSNENKGKYSEEPMRTQSKYNL